MGYLSYDVSLYATTDILHFRLAKFVILFSNRPESEYDLESTKFSGSVVTRKTQRVGLVASSQPFIVKEKCHWLRKHEAAVRAGRNGPNRRSPFSPSLLLSFMP